MARRKVTRAGWGLMALSLFAAPAARGAGFDTPILYTARHQAMGGTAIGYVDEASAVFHNPAGLQGVRGLAFTGDFSMILGKVRGSPTPSQNLESQTVVAPFFLAGGAYRLHEWVTFGAALFPVASGGAEYKYPVGDATWLDKTQILFLEASPALSINVPKDRWLPGKLAFGAGWRFNSVTFDRKRGEPERFQYLDLEMSGKSFGGFRVGVQYQPLEALKLGLVFRNKVTVTTKASSATVLTAEGTDASLDFTLPAKLGFGGRLDLGDFGVASDLEYAFQSQNKRPPLSGTIMGQSTEVQNVFDWTNGVTWRSGVEYRVGRQSVVPLRIGYIYDTRVSNPTYPSAFGTPPGPTHTFTFGAGYVRESWQLNWAIARRTGSANVTSTDTRCVFCGYPGKYEIEMTGFYVDASVDLPM